MMDDTNNHQDLKSIDGRDRSTTTDEAQTEFKQRSSEKLEFIFTDMNQALQELADSGQIMFLCGSPDASGLSPVLKEYNPQQNKVIMDTIEPPSVGPEDDIPCDGKQTVDFLTNTTKDLASVHHNRTLGYIFNSMCGSLSVLKTLRVVDVIEARKRLGLPTTSIDSVAQCREPINQKEQAKPGTTVVHAERVVVDSQKMIKILKFENVAYMKTLPKDYLKGLPKFYRCNDWHKELIMLHETIGATNTLAYSVSPGTIVSLKDFGQMIKTMKEAAARLSKIIKTAKLEREHSGKFTVSI